MEKEKKTSTGRRGAVATARAVALLCALLSTILLVSCTSAVTDGTDRKNESSETVQNDVPSSDTCIQELTSSEVTSGQPDTSAQPPDISVPDDYYEFPDIPVECSSVIIPKEYNAGLYFDIKPVMSGDMMYFILPCRTDISRVVYHALDSKGTLKFGRVADFTDAGNQSAKTVSINGKRYTIEAIISDVPSLCIEIDENFGTFEDMYSDLTKETRAYGNMSLECADATADENGWRTLYQSREGDDSLPCTMYLKGRGNWSWNTPDKKGYALKLEKKENLLGLGSSKNWVLQANAIDPSMLKNHISNYLASAAGLDFTPDGRHVDLFVNGEYMGLYYLTEKVEIGDNRVHIHDLEDDIKGACPSGNYGAQRMVPTHNGKGFVKFYNAVPELSEITGGYLVEMELPDRFAAEKCGFCTSRGYYYVIKSPEYVSYKQAMYIYTLFQNAEDAFFSEDGYNPQTGKYYTEYIDLDSFVKKYWIEEISKNHDGVVTSQFFYKPADDESEKIFAGPVWDYDIAYGYSAETTDPEGWFMREKEFYRELMKHEDFEKRASEIFIEYYLPAALKFITAEADRLVSYLNTSSEMNDIVWSSLSEMTYADCVDDLSNYLHRRILWIYSELTARNN